MQLNIKTSVITTHEVDIDIPVPSFWKEDTSAYDGYRAVLNEKTFVEVYRFWNSDIVSIENSTVERRKDRVVEAQNKWKQVTEDEFMELYETAFERMILTPKIAV